jgi:uncharacterized protein YbcV (DUF1398 family)
MVARRPDPKVLEKLARAHAAGVLTAKQYRRALWTLAASVVAASSSAVQS